MNGAPHASADRPDAPSGLASWYVPGHADGFGDRLLMFDNTSTPSLELLRFRRELLSHPEFEEALRERIHALRAFRHSSFSSIRALKHLDDGDSLALVSEHAAGQRLSDFFNQTPQKGLNPAIVTWLLRELTPALVALQAQGKEIWHGALTPDRIVLGPDGRLHIIEHVLGSAVDALQKSSTTLWRDFSIIAKPDEEGVAQMDASVDVAQLASIALSMLLARPLTLQDLQHRVPALLDEFAELTAAPSLHHVSPLRFWIERALHVGGNGYRSAADAQYDVRQLPTHAQPMMIAGATPVSPIEAPAVPPEVETQAESKAETLVDVPAAPAAAAPAAAAPPAPTPASPTPVVSLGSRLRNPSRSQRRGEAAKVMADNEPESLDTFPSERIEPEPPAPTVTPPAVVEVQAAAPASARPPVRPILEPVDERDVITPPIRAVVTPISRKAIPLPRRIPFPKGLQFPRGIPLPAGKAWIIPAMAGALVAQAAVIAFLVLRPAAILPPAGVIIESAQAGDQVFVNGKPAGTTPLQLDVDAATKSVRILSSARASENAPDASARGQAAAPKAGDTVIERAAAIAPRARLRLVTPIAVKIFEGSEALGSTDDGPISLSPGEHQLDFVNTALGYRAHQTITVRAGQVLTLPLTPPDGLVSINAQPWANVSIDGKAIGETPLGNIKVGLGEHEVTFRHPELGEQRRTVVVRAGEVARVSVTFSR